MKNLRGIIGQWLCPVPYGHDWIYRVDRERRCVFLECFKCGKTTTGWVLDARIPEPIQFNDR